MTEQQNLSGQHAALYPNDRTQQFVSPAHAVESWLVSGQMLSRDVLAVPTPPEISLPAGKCSFVFAHPANHFPRIPFFK